MNEAMREIEVIVVGASAGAVDAMSHILPRLSRAFPLPIVVVVHVPPERPSGLAHLFASRTALEVKEAEDKMPLAPGTLFFAPPDYHVLLEADHTLSLSVDEQVNFSRPSIDVLFDAAAESFGRRALGIALTGASADGARGLLHLRDAGGIAIVQDPSTAFARALPDAALAMARPQHVLDIVGIGDLLLTLDPEAGA